MILRSYTLSEYYNIQHFNFQLMHTMLKNVELLKHINISKTAPTYFGLQGSNSQYLDKNYTLV